MNCNLEQAQGSKNHCAANNSFQLVSINIESIRNVLISATIGLRSIFSLSFGTIFKRNVFISREREREFIGEATRQTNCISTLYDV